MINARKLPCGALRRHGAGQQLLDAVLALAGNHGSAISHKQRPWHSVTFSGTRHSFELVFSGEAAVLAGEALIELLPEHEFTIPGNLVADACVSSSKLTVVPEWRLDLAIELLLLDDR